LSAKQRISTIGRWGRLIISTTTPQAVSGATAYGYLPPPYVGGDLASIFPKVFDVEDTYTINNR